MLPVRIHRHHGIRRLITLPDISKSIFENSTFAAILPVGKNRSIGCRLFEHLMVTAAAAIIDDHNLKSCLTKLAGSINQFQIRFKCRN